MEPSASKNGLTNLILIGGVLFDQITTRLGIFSPMLSEANPITSYLIRNGYWFLTDALLLIGLMIFSRELLQSDQVKHQRMGYFLPLISGLVRLIVSMSNVRLLLLAL